MKMDIQCLLYARDTLLTGAFLKRAAQATLSVMAQKKLLRTPRGTTVSLGLVTASAARMARLNWKHLRHRGPTDVLSFPAGVPGDLGELVLCPQVLRRHSKTYQQHVRVEAARMIIHGALHCLGWDHATRAQERRMFAQQERLLGVVCRRLRLRANSSTTKASLNDFIEERTRHG